MQKGHAASPDYMNFQGAKRLRAKIEAYWNKRGVYPIVRVVAEAGVKDGQNLYVVRSNIRFDEKGYPRVTA